MNHSLTVGRHHARRARVTRDHRIKSPTVNAMAAILLSTPPSPILARLRRAELKLLHQNSNCTTDTVSPISRIPQEHNLTMVNVTPILQPDFWGYVWSGLVRYAGDQVDAANT